MSGYEENVDNSSNDQIFEPINLLDARMYFGKQQFAVLKSGQNISSYSEANSNSSTNSTSSFNVVLPSLSTIIDRVVMVRGKMTF